MTLQNARVQNLAEKTSYLVDPNFGSCWLPPAIGSQRQPEIEMLGLFPWRRSFLQTQVSFKMFLMFMLIDDRSAMPNNVLLRKACWSASSARWFGFAFSRIYEEAYCLSATTRNSDAVQMKIVLPQIAKWHEMHESIELLNEMRGNVLQKLWEGDSFFDASYTRRSTPCSGYLFKGEDA